MKREIKKLKKKQLQEVKNLKNYKENQKDLELNHLIILIVKKNKEVVEYDEKKDSFWVGKIQ